MTRTTVVDMESRIEQIRRAELPPLEGQRDEIRREAQENYDTWNLPPEIERRYEQIKNEIADLEGEANTLEHYMDQWDGGKFVIRELSVGAVAMIQDDVAEASGADFQGGGTPKTGYAKTRTLEVGVKDKPNGAPDVEDFPDAVGDWLFDAIDEFNTRGEVQLGNSSLRADMMRSEN